MRTGPLRPLRCPVHRLASPDRLLRSPHADLLHRQGSASHTELVASLRETVAEEFVDQGNEVTLAKRFQGHSSTEGSLKSSLAVIQSKHAVALYIHKAGAKPVKNTHSRSSRGLIETRTGIDVLVLGREAGGVA